MAWLTSELTARERDDIRRLVRAIGEWVRRYEPSPTVDEDLACHRLRTLLAQLLDAAGRLEKRTAHALMRDVTRQQYKLVLLRAERGVQTTD